MENQRLPNFNPVEHSSMSKVIVYPTTGTTPLVLPAVCFPPIDAFLHHVFTLYRSFEVVFFACENLALATAAIAMKSELYN